jgi:hypothetical protein
VELRFDRIHFRDLNTPAVCQDDSRTYVWALLDKTGIVPPDDNATVIESPSSPGTTFAKPRQVVPATKHVPIPEPVSTMKTTTSPTVAPKPAKQQPATSVPTGNSIEQAIALRNQLRALLTNSNELIRALKRQKHQQRLMAATLQSLKQLQTVA